MPKKKKATKKKQTRKRSNAFSRHPDGEYILTQVLNKDITQEKAAELLGCSGPNIHYYLKNNLKMKVAKKDKKPQPSPSAMDEAKARLSQLEKFKLEVDGQTPLELMGTVGWRTVQQLLLKFSQENLELPELIMVSRELRTMLQFQFSHNVPDIPQDQVQLSKEVEEAVEEAVNQVMKDHDKWCPYYTKFSETKDKSQKSTRLESEQPSLVE